MLESRFTRLLVVCGAWFAFGAFARAAGSDEIALRIKWGDQTSTVTRDEFANWALLWRGEYIAQDFARARGLAQVAEQAGVRITQAEVEAALDAELAERIEGAFSGSRGDWLAELDQSDRTEAGYRAMRRLQIREELFVQRMVGDKRKDDPLALERAFELRYGRGGRRLELDVIRIDVVAQIAEGVDNVERLRLEELARRAGFERAKALADQAHAGADFAELARKNSDDAKTRGAGGRVEGFFEPRFWPDAALDALAALQEGAISEPIFAVGDWFVVRARRVVVTRIDEVRDELKAIIARTRPSTDEVAAYASSLQIDAAVTLEPALWNTRERSPNDIVFRVGGAPVTRAEFIAYAMPSRAESMEASFLEQWWVAEKARRAGVVVDDAQIQSRVDADLEQRIRDLYLGNREKWLQELKRQGRTEESYQREQRVKARIDLLGDLTLAKERVPTEADLRRAWEARYGKDGRKVEVRMLAKRFDLPVFHEEVPRERYDELVRAKRAEVREKLLALRRRALAGEDFAKLAAAESDDVETKATGGAFPGGWRDGRWSFELATTVRALSVGQITEPLETPETFAIFRLESEVVTPFEKVRAEIEKALHADRPAPAERASWINVGMRELSVTVEPGLYR